MRNCAAETAQKLSFWRRRDGRAGGPERVWAQVASRAAKGGDADDLPGGEIARWAASRIGDGLRGRKAVVITREEADMILKAARAAASPWQKRQPLKPAFDVARSDAAIRKRLAVYQARLDRLAREGRPPSLLLARSISRDVRILEKYQRRWV